MPTYIFKDAHDFTITGGNFGTIMINVSKRSRKGRSTRRRQPVPSATSPTSSWEDESNLSSPTSSGEEGSNPSLSSPSATPSHPPASSVHMHSLTFPNVPKPRPTSQTRAEFLASGNHTGLRLSAPAPTRRAAQVLQHPQSLALAATITDVDVRH